MAMKNKILLPLLIIGIFINAEIQADPLLLSDAEMQKLQHYFPSQEGETHLLWKGDPIAIALPLNQEKRLVFPTNVMPDLKGVLTTDQLRIVNDDKSLYLTALKPFATTRMYVTLQDSGAVLLIDLSTSNNGSQATTYIDNQPTNNNKNNNSQSLTTETINNTGNNTDSLSMSDMGNTSVSDSDNYVTLIRFAWQQLYAPERLLNNSLGISRAPMHTLPVLATLIYGDKVYAHPEISWVYNNTYVTAVELRNKYSHATTINLNRDLCGNWQAASLYPRSHLKSAGDKDGDSTVLFLISKEPFGDSMEVCNGGA